MGGHSFWYAQTQHVWIRPISAGTAYCNEDTGESTRLSASPDGSSASTRAGRFCCMMGRRGRSHWSA